MWELVRSNMRGMTLHGLVQVEAYAQQFRFLQLEHEEVSQRLLQLERLLKQHSCTTSEQLLEATAKAGSGLDQWFQMEGGLALGPSNIQRRRRTCAHPGLSGKLSASGR